MKKVCGLLIKDSQSTSESNNLNKVVIGGVYRGCGMDVSGVARVVKLLAPKTVHYNAIYHVKLADGDVVIGFYNNIMSEDSFKTVYPNEIPVGTWDKAVDCLSEYLRRDVTKPFTGDVGWI